MRKLTILTIASLLALAAGACDQAPTGSETPELQPQTNSDVLRLTDRSTRTVEIPQDPNDDIRACKAGGGFEELEGTATIRTIVHVLISPSGQATVQFHNFNKARAVGVETGTVYEVQETNESSETFEFDGTASPPFTDTFTNHLLVVSHGSAPNLMLHLTKHFTINAEGELTSLVVEFRTECV